MKKLIIFVLLAITILIFKESIHEEKIIPKDAIRFRIIANSNKIEDQNIKLKVRDNVEKKLTTMLIKSTNITTSRKIIKHNLSNINKTVQQTLTTNQSDQTYRINYGQNYFPQKIYKQNIYKAGYYESLVITLGEGKGDNWWCVLFPPLCVLEAKDSPKSKNIEYKFYLKDIIDKYF